MVQIKLPLIRDLRPVVLKQRIMVSRVHNLEKQREITGRGRADAFKVSLNSLYDREFDRATHIKHMLLIRSYKLLFCQSVTIL